MARGAEQRPNLGFFHLAPGIHDHNAFSDFRHHAKVMRDQHNGGTDAVLEIPHQVQNLRLDGHIQGRGGFIGDQQLRVAGKRNGNHHALAHAA